MGGVMVSGAAHRFPVRVYYEDTDAGGIVYHASYLRFMERARTEWLRAEGFEQQRLRDEHGLMFTVSRLCIDYRLPAVYDDRLEVGVKIARARRASLDLAQDVYREDGRLMASANVQVACLNATTMRPCPMPRPLRSELERDT
ncbi:MAG: tol-pal system-associated acyl-CoA thioesterase [Salinibacterium sp.]|nr:tol-pal system-associated acyl-CoA thioesterase [Salinibacterium sp.]